MVRRSVVLGMLVSIAACSRPHAAKPVAEARPADTKPSVADPKRGLKPTLVEGLNVWLWLPLEFTKRDPAGKELDFFTNPEATIAVSVRASTATSLEGWMEALKHQLESEDWQTNDVTMDVQILGRNTARLEMSRQGGEIRVCYYGVLYGSRVVSFVFAADEQHYDRASFDRWASYVTDKEPSATTLRPAN